MLELLNVKKYYKNNRAVDGISFNVRKGEVLGLIGANGAGKTTTLSMIATLLKPDSGSILFEGMDIADNPSALRESLGYIPQEVALYPMLTGKDNLIFWGRANHIKGKKLKHRIQEVARIIRLEDAVLGQKVSSYSGGMKRRLNIGAALLHQPSLIIMDEPTVGLDVEARNEILNTVLELRKQGAGIIYAGHYMEEMEKICDTICLLHQGKSILYGAKEEILKDKLNLEQVYLESIRGESISVEQSRIPQQNGD